MAEGKLKAVVVNAGRLDFDAKLDLSALQAIADVTRHESDATPEQIVERVAGQNIVITKEIPVPAAAINNFPESVKIICEAGTGTNNIDMAAAKERGITVCNVPGYSTDAVAQMVVTFLLNFSSSLVAQQRMLWQGNRDNFTRCLQVPHFELNGKTLGLIGGNGAIGKKVAEIAATLGMQILVSSRSGKCDVPGATASTVEELLTASDFISIHCPLTPDTKHLINKDSLKLMKPSAFIINTARGPIINEGDLIEALQEGKIAGAGLDVQDVEPPSDDSPLYTLENVILTPHIGWKRLETRQRLMNLTAENVSAFVAGAPRNVVS